MATSVSIQNYLSYTAAQHVEQLRYLDEKIRLLESLAHDAQATLGSHSVRSFIESLSYED